MPWLKNIGFCASGTIVSKTQNDTVPELLRFGAFSKWRKNLPAMGRKYRLRCTQRPVAKRSPNILISCWCLDRVAEYNFRGHSAMNIEDIQIALFDMYDLRTALHEQRDELLSPQESEETIGGCIDGVIQLLESLESECGESLSGHESR